MGKKIKKVIAIEGLVIIAFAIASILSISVGSLIKNTCAVCPDPTLSEMRANLGSNLRRIGIFVPLLGYPLYLIIRFITWAIEALREK